jgi:hypothetical protein
MSYPKKRAICDCGNAITNGNKACARCLRLEGGDFAGYKMTETWQQRRARKMATGERDGDKFLIPPCFVK